MTHKYYLVAATLALLGSAAPAMAQVAPALSLDPFPKGQFFQSNDQFIFELKRPLVHTSDTQTSIFFWNSAGRFRFKRVTGSETLLDELAQPALGYRILNVELNPTTDRLPSALNVVALAGAVPLGTVGPGQLSLIAGAGYAGNSPFNDSEALYGIGHLLYGLPLSGSADAASATAPAGSSDTALVLSLDYDGHSSFMPDTPLPGIALAGRTRDDTGTTRLAWLAGFPYSMLTWQPPNLDHRVQLDLKYTFPESGMARASVRVVKGVSLYASYTNFLEAFRIHETPDYSADRMFLQMRRAELGVRVVSGKLIDLTVGVGYAFNQTLQTGFDARELHPAWTLRDTPYVTFQIGGAF